MLIHMYEAIVITSIVQFDILTDDIDKKLVINKQKAFFPHQAQNKQRIKHDSKIERKC